MEYKKQPVIVYPLEGQHIRQESANNDICPECGDELDTGFECIGCGFDAESIVKAS
jgi:hypothetical protein